MNLDIWLKTFDQILYKHQPLTVYYCQYSVLPVNLKQFCNIQFQMAVLLWEYSSLEELSF